MLLGLDFATQFDLIWDTHIQKIGNIDNRDGDIKAIIYCMVNCRLICIYFVHVWHMIILTFELGFIEILAF